MEKQIDIYELDNDRFDEISKKWNWGAFSLTFIWGLFNNVQMSLLAIVPIFFPIVAFYLGWNGNRLALYSKEWKDFDDFEKCQRKWSVWGIIFIVIDIITIIGWSLVPMLVDYVNGLDVTLSYINFMNITPLIFISAIIIFDLCLIIYAIRKSIKINREYE